MAAKEEKKDDKKDDKKKDDAAKAKGGEEGDAPAAEGETPEGGEGGKRNIKKLVLFIVLPLLLLIGGGGGAYFLGAFDKFLAPKELVCDNIKEGDEDYEACQKKFAEETGIQAPGAFLEIPDLIINLNSSSKQPRFLKIAIKLELDTESDVKKMETVMPRVVDHFQTYLRELRVEDLKGSAGIYRLRLELLSRVNAAAPNIKVRDVLFQEILIQ